MKNVVAYLRVKEKLRRGEKLTRADVITVFRTAEESIAALIDITEDTIH